MGAMDLGAIMDGVATLLSSSSIAPTVYGWPADSVSVPCAVVGYPTRMEFDTVMGRGGDLVELPVYVLVGRTGTKDSRDALSAILADTSSVKSALDGARSFGSVRVTDATIDEVTVSGLVYLAARFTTEVFT